MLDPRLRALEQALGALHPPEPDRHVGVEVALAEAQLERHPRRGARVAGAAVQPVGALQRPHRGLLLAEPARGHAEALEPGRRRASSTLAWKASRAASHSPAASAARPASMCAPASWPATASSSIAGRIRRRCTACRLRGCAALTASSRRTGASGAARRRRLRTSPCAAKCIACMHLAARDPPRTTASVPHTAGSPSLDALAARRRQGGADDSHAQERGAVDVEHASRSPSRPPARRGRAPRAPRPRRPPRAPAGSRRGSRRPAGRPASRPPCRSPSTPGRRW